MTDNRSFYYTVLMMKNTNERHSVRIAVPEFSDFQDQLEESKFIHFLTTDCTIFSVATNDIRSLDSKVALSETCSMTFVVNPVPHLHFQQVKLHPDPGIYINEDIYENRS